MKRLILQEHKAYENFVLFHLINVGTTTNYKPFL